jgi:hypothetical protein
MYTYTLEKNKVQILPVIKCLLDAEELVGSALLPLPSIGSAGRTSYGDPSLVLTDDTPRLGLCGILWSHM